MKQCLWLLILVLSLGMMVPVLQAEPTKIYKLLIVDSQNAEPYITTREAMLEGLRKLGYEKDKNLQVTYHSIGNDVEKGKQLLNEELKNNYDVIFINGTMITIAAKEVAFGKPEYKFVFAGTTDPVGVGVIDNFVDPPKGNVTGVCYPMPAAARLKFIRDLMPKAKTIGWIYADMPQAHSYRRWIEDAIATKPELNDLKVIFRMVPFITGEDGSAKMAQEAKAFVLELDSQVDVFVSPNDQLGVNRPFAEMVYGAATKPLIGLGFKDVMDHWGATAVIFPALGGTGPQTARMIKRLFEGEPISKIIPEWPKGFGVAFDLVKCKKFGVAVPVNMIELAGSNIVTQE